MAAPDSHKEQQATNAFGRVTKGRRASDFLVLAGAGLLVVAGLVGLGEMTVWAAVFSALIMAAFSFAYFAGTADLHSEAIRTAQAAESAEGARTQAESGRLYRTALIEALPEPAMFIDGQGKVEAANAPARRQFRIPDAGPMLSAVVRRPELLDAVVQARLAQTSQRFEFVERDETDRYFTCVAAPLGTGVLVTLYDFTEIKRSAMARVDFLANASHELRTPLTSLSEFIDTLRGPAKDDPAARDKFLDIMHGQAERMRRLISDLMSLSRIELVEHRPPEGEANLAAVAAEAGDALLPVAAARGVKLNVSGGQSVTVTGMRDELAQVAQNLIDNAIKYSEDGGVVEIEVAAGLTREEASARAGRRWEGAGRMSMVTAPVRQDEQARFAVLRVSDSGPGIERQYLPRLSERFYRVDPGRGLRPGTGLGLAIVKHVVQRHRGEFLVESEPGRGTAFGVVLPMADGKRAQPEAGLEPAAILGG